MFFVFLIHCCCCVVLLFGAVVGGMHTAQCTVNTVYADNMCDKRNPRTFGMKNTQNNEIILDAEKEEIYMSKREREESTGTCVAVKAFEQAFVGVSVLIYFFSLIFAKAAGHGKSR